MYLEPPQIGLEGGTHTQAYAQPVRTAAAPVAGALDAPDLQPIRLHLAEMVLVASVNPGNERMTDILQRGGELRVLPAGADPSVPESWLGVPTDDIMLVIPPPHVSTPEKRVERLRHEVHVRIGECRLVGTGHLRPGAELDAVLRTTQPFMPLTEVTMTMGAGGYYEQHAVAIINLRYAEFVTD